MDSLTQIVLGAAVGEAVLGKKVGNKAMLYGAIAGTIPDLDVISTHFLDTTQALAFHRGFTHSIAFSVLFAPVLGWLVSRYEKLKSIKDWSLLFFWAFVTHPILDAHTTWGTQLFWPFDLRLAFQTIFVIDPLYTLPFLVFLIMAMRQNRHAAKRRRYNNLGLYVSTTYLMLTFALKALAYRQFEQALEHQQIEYTAMDTRPAPMNTLLWSANVQTADAFLLANYSFFDTQPITFTSYPKNHALLEGIKNNERVQRMIAITEGWYTVREEASKLYFNDLRFGLMSLEPNAQEFVFQYEIVPQPGNTVSFVETEKNRADGAKLLRQLWDRVLGN